MYRKKRYTNNLELNLIEGRPAFIKPRTNRVVVPGWGERYFNNVNNVKNITTGLERHEGE